jgi:3-phosphoshikimate 1-carboxyvinyltransferase
MFAEGETIIEGSECINTSYPGFEHDLNLFLRGDTGAAPIRVLTRVTHQVADRLRAAE